MKLKQIVILCLLPGLSAFGFSSYENRLLAGDQTHMALIAAAKDGEPAELQTALKSLNEKKATKAFKKAKISNISSFTKELQGKTWIMVYFDYDGNTYLDAVNAFESTEVSQKIMPLVEAHPRAKKYGTTWLQMEWMCYIRGAQKKGAPTSKLAMVTRIKPEKEQEYRVLHQSVWPGVVDQMARSNNRNFSIFFTEIGDELYEFFYLEYVGSDAKKDGEMSSSDPFNLRWWKITDACQNPLPDADGIWSMMDKVSK